MTSISTCLASARPRLISFNPHPKPSLLTRSLVPPSLHLYLKSPTYRVSAMPRVIRASVDAPAGFKPGGVETDKLQANVRNRTMEAVDSYGGRMTIGDVASKAGLKTNEAERALQAITADTGGFLEVSDEGDVLYVFPKDYHAKLVARSFRIKIEPALDKVKAASEYLIRVSFGTTLVVSILLVYTAILALLSSKSDDDDRGRRRGRSFSSDLMFFFRPSDIFWIKNSYVDSVVDEPGNLSNN